MKTSSKTGGEAIARKARLLSRLQGGDRRSIGHSNEVSALVLSRPRLFSSLIEGLWHDDPVVRMRTADAVEKISLQKPALLKPFKAEILGLMAEASQPELRWHLALMVGRLSLKPLERKRAVALLRSYLGDRSSIVKTCAMQGLVDLAADDEKLRPAITELLRRYTSSGTPAMRARGRKLLARLEHEESLLTPNKRQTNVSYT